MPNARSLIETQFSAAAVAELDLNTLQLEDGSFVDPDLREKFSDLLFSVSLAQKSTTKNEDQALVYLLFEHKSQADPFTVLQLLAKSNFFSSCWEIALRLTVSFWHADWITLRLCSPSCRSDFVIAKLEPTMPTITVDLRTSLTVDSRLDLD